MADDLSIVSISSLGAVVGTITSAQGELDGVFATVQNLSTNLNAALTGSALGPFETNFLTWLQQISEIKADMDSAQAQLNTLYQTALAASAALSTLNVTTPSGSF